MSDQSNEDLKAKMLAALAKKSNNSKNLAKSSNESGKKLGSGQQSGGAPKMHRRKSGSA